jgi:hypothetical protein
MDASIADYSQARHSERQGLLSHGTGDRICGVEPMDQIVAEGQASRRFNTVIISSFAAAVLLSLLEI